MSFELSNDPSGGSGTVQAQLAEATPRVSFGEGFLFWLKRGFINFGGPAGQIAIMHRELVEQRRWVPEPLFLRALNFSMLLPGPEATELAIYVAWRNAWHRGRDRRRVILRRPVNLR